MPIQTTSKIWHNGTLIPWEQANIHVMSHVIHYGSSVFEGIRCYGQPQDSAVFQALRSTMQRLLDSAKIYRTGRCPSRLEEFCAGVVDLIEANGVAPCYIRPIALRGYGEIGVSPKGSPIEVYIANFPWGKYIAGHGGADVCVLRVGPAWPRTCHAFAGQGRRQLHELTKLIHMEAEVNGYAGGAGLDVNGPGERRLRREYFCRPQRRSALYAATGQLCPLGHHPRQRAHHCAAFGTSR